MKLDAAFSPLFLEIRNESRMHGRSETDESHFTVIVVSHTFEHKSLLEQQRMVHAALHEELKEIHAFSFKTITASQWEKNGQVANLIPPTCRGGSSMA